LRLIVRAAIAAFLLVIATAAPAESPLLRSERSAADPSPLPSAIQTNATVESASLEAQRAIRACDDSVALRCVADVLAEYAAALNAIRGRRDRVRRPLPKRVEDTARLNGAGRRRRARRMCMRRRLERGMALSVEELACLLRSKRP
jgi:hypothetical protein